MKYNIKTNIISKIKCNDDLIKIAQILSKLNSNYDRKIIVGIACDYSKSAKKVLNKISKYFCDIKLIFCVGRINNASKYLKTKMCDISIYFYCKNGVNAKILSANGYEIDEYYRVILNRRFLDYIKFDITECNRNLNIKYIDKYYDNQFNSNPINLKIFCERLYILSKISHLNFNLIKQKLNSVNLFNFFENLTIKFCDKYFKKSSNIIFKQSDKYLKISLYNNKILFSSNFLLNFECKLIFLSMIMSILDINSFIYFTKKYYYRIDNSQIKKLKISKEYDIIKMCLEEGTNLIVKNQKIFLSTQYNFDDTLLFYAIIKSLNKDDK